VTTDEAVLDALRELAAFLSDSGGWEGRENEVANLLGISMIGPRVGGAEWIGIGVAVRGVGAKPRVNKDIVVWPEPHMTLWSGTGLWPSEVTDAVNIPSTIVELKVLSGTVERSGGTRRPSSYDREFLKAFAEIGPAGWAGWAVFADCRRGAPPLRIVAVRVSADEEAEYMF
jgi:hypothetical protein